MTVTCGTDVGYDPYDVEIDANPYPGVPAVAGRGAALPRNVLILEAPRPTRCPLSRVFMPMRRSTLEPQVWEFCLPVSAGPGW